MRLTANKIAGTLREHGYKLTPQRHAILKIIAASNDHLTPEAIHQKASLNNPTLGLVTVYRTLELLDELNLVCRLHAPDGCRGYMMRRPTEHHHHLICSQCGRVVDFTDCTLSNLEQRLSKETRYDINGHLLEFYGLCPECRPASG
jgi:Fur family ferric uptake transcriptional regulator